MLNNEILEKQFFAMTGAEIIELFSSIVPFEQKPQVKDFTTEKYVYGISGLANLLGCGKTKAQEIKNSGTIDDAIIQNGKKLIINADLALELLKKNLNK